MNYADRASIVSWAVVILLAAILFVPWHLIGTLWHRALRGLKTGHWSRGL